jgi:ABC-type multidrug transport system ATPase subunit
MSSIPPIPSIPGIPTTIPIPSTFPSWFPTIPPYPSNAPPLPPNPFPTKIPGYPGNDNSQSGDVNVTQCLEILSRIEQYLCFQKALSISNYSSCDSGLPGIPITEGQFCGDGFYCPNVDANRTETWPQYCPPTQECQFLRLEGQWCTRQGLYEPEVCQGGSYCPNSSLTMPCTEGHFCPRGTKHPRLCGPMSYCPEGSQTPRFFGGVLISIMIDFVLVFGFFYLRFVREPQQNKRNAIKRRNELVQAAQKLAPSLTASLVTVASSLEVKSQSSFSSPSSLSSLSLSPDFKRENLEPEDFDCRVKRQSFFEKIAFQFRSMIDSIAIQSVRTTLPSGVLLDHGGRVRTKSFRRPSGFGPMFSSLEKEDEKFISKNVEVTQDLTLTTSTPLKDRRERVAKVASDTYSSSNSPDVGKSPSSFTSPFSSLAAMRAMSLAKQPFSALVGSGNQSLSIQEDPLDRLVATSATVVLEDGFRRCNAGLRLGIEFFNLRLTLPAPLSKTILSDVTGSIVPGRVTAIMGPSGAGKTTFLSVLMGKVKRTAGTIKVNGIKDELSTFRRITGFVPQDDTMMRELTVRENIAHSARIRLPRTGWTEESVSRLVDAVIETLGLRSCADTQTARISGGQRKRANIGMELAMAPAAIFLDEPTSGLDATAALEVCSTLRAIANLGLTVVAVIHQPRLEIFRSFDDLLLLAPGGKTVFLGPQNQVMHYFAQAGFSFNPLGNPADDLLDFIAGRSSLKVPVHKLTDARAANDAAENAMKTILEEALLAEIDIATPRSWSIFSKWISPVSDITKKSNEVIKRTNPLSMDDSSKRPSFPETYSSSAFEKIAALFEKSNPNTLVDLEGVEVAQYLSALWRLNVQEETSGRIRSPSGGGSGEAPSSESIGITLSEAPQTTGDFITSAWKDFTATATKTFSSITDPQNMQSRHDGSPFNLMMSNRGASYFRQLYLCHSRSLLQQYRQPPWLVLELCVSSAAGMAMGLAAQSVDELYSGVLRPPFTVLGPAPMETMLPNLGFFINIAVGVAGSPAAVRAFGEERDVFMREYEGGHSVLAYYTAKNIAALYRLLLASLHFSGFFAYLARPVSEFYYVFNFIFGAFFGVYGLATLMSMLVDRANAALLGTIASLIVASLCGYGPNLKQGKEWGISIFQDLSYSRWVNELFIHAETMPYRDLFLVEEITADIFGYSLNRPTHDIFMMAFIGLLLRFLALIGLYIVARQISLESILAKIWLCTYRSRTNNI